MAYGGQALINNAEMEECVVALGNARLHRIGIDVIIEVLKAPISEAIALNDITKVLGDIFLFKNLRTEFASAAHAGTELLLKQHLHEG